jgi:HSP20 family protein
MAPRDPDWMWREACEMLEQAERLHRQFFTPAQRRARRPTWEPPVDVFEADGELSILAAQPGVAVDQQEVIIDGRSLVVAGHRQIPAPSPNARILRLEIPHGQFERRIDLPLGRYEISRRELVNGCLVLVLRKLG